MEGKAEASESMVAPADVQEVSGQAAETGFEAIRKDFEAGKDLSDEQVDAVADVAVEVVRSILACFGEGRASIDEYEGDEGELILDVNKGDLAILIGRHGVTLDALQLVVTSLVNRRLGFHYPVVVDVEGYKSRRREKLQSMARNAAARAKRENRAVRLAPMNAYERRLVHLALRGDATVATHSEGADPSRCVVVTAVKVTEE